MHLHVDSHFNFVVSKVMLLAVEGWQLDIIKYLVTECGMDVDSE